MKRYLPYLLVGLVALSAGNRKLKRLEPDEKQHYRALKVWMDDKERKAYLKLKTRPERDAWLKDQGYWERFYQYDERTRDDILAGDVHKGWTQDKLLMAWGPAHTRNRLTGRKAERAERFVYRFEVLEGGKVLIWEPDSKTAHVAIDKYTMEVVLENGVIVEMNKSDGW